MAEMPRQIRVKHPGAIYHVMGRGDRQKDIYLDEVDRQDLLNNKLYLHSKTKPKK